MGGCNHQKGLRARTPAATATGQARWTTVKGVILSVEPLPLPRFTGM
ncbi:hypothetical protein MYA_1186 [Burkholderia sp. KJ006]|nr:hypothetical protein MYA_1186 [Burkholderia sp. KJ006]